MSEINLKKRVKESYEKIAQVFDESRTRPWKGLVEVLDKIANHGVRLIDVGCGSGANARYLYERYREKYVGVDISLNMLKKLKECVGDIDLICGDISSLPIRDRAANIVTCIATIHHLSTKKDRVQALGELCRISREGSHVVILVWRIESKSSLRRYVEISDQDIILPWTWKLREKVERYYHLYTANEILEEAHLCKIRYRYNIRIIMRNIVRIGRFLNDLIIILRC
ncbi:MAG: class I SAM-dependent methyltransferase [Crenarchaeota archaeon]|nr:class I SAM-dependent methyltransferase [Thermoproteota archaeon]